MPNNTTKLKITNKRTKHNKTCVKDKVNNHLLRINTSKGDPMADIQVSDLYGYLQARGFGKASELQREGLLKCLQNGINLSVFNIA